MRTVLAALAATSLAGLAAAPLAQADPPTQPTVRIATFNASLNRAKAGQLVTDLSTPDNKQAANAAETIQRAAPDIVLVNEFDYVADGSAIALFSDNYLKKSHNGSKPIDYPYSWTGPVNTGVDSGFDLNNDGKLHGPDDSFGFGLFPGQYGFVVYSKYPIKADDVRTFQKFLWKDMPHAMLPDNPDTPHPADWFTPAEKDVVRLSSKTHADIPIDVNGRTLHVLAAHPTPPSFDGPERRNKLRNHDEIRLWADYISDKADYLYDDAGTTGGLAPGSAFAILGDYNTDPNDGDSEPGAIQQLLNQGIVTDPQPTSDGAVEAARNQGAANSNHKTNPKFDTADFNDKPAPGNLRVDYTLLSSGLLTALDSAVFWPVAADPLSRLTGEHPFPTSDHRLVWVDAAFTDVGPRPTPTPTSTPTPTVAPTGQPTPPPAAPVHPPRTGS